MGNPFDISFGKKPSEVISRFRQYHQITDVFTSETISQQIYMITGVRGSGKTVLMNTIANELEEDKKWIVVRLNTERDMLHSFASKLSSDNDCIKWFKAAKINLTALGLGLEISGEPPVTDVEAALEKMLKSIREKGRRVLVTVDEAVNNQQMKAFCSSFQLLIGQELPVYLLMTGLYENIEELQNEKNLTFLYRAPKLRVEPLNITMIASRYQKLFSLTEENALALAQLTKGYPFAFQALGFSAWNHGMGQNAFMPEYRQLLEEYVYEKIWSELSEKDKRIANGIAHSTTGRIHEINEYLGLKPDEINQYRKRLIRKGIVDGDQHGYLHFTLPLFSEFVLTQG